MAPTRPAVLSLHTVDECLKLLQSLQDLINDLSGRTALDPFYLDGLSRNLDVKNGRLERWRSDLVSNGRSDAQRPNYVQVMRDADDHTHFVKTNIELIQRRLKGVNYRAVTENERHGLESAIRQAVNQIDASINVLQKSYSDLRQDGLRADINRIAENALTNEFARNIQRIPVDLRRKTFRAGSTKLALDFGELEWFWKPIRTPVSLSPALRPPERVRIGSQGDGHVITVEYLNNARKILRHFRDAWIKVIEEDPASEFDDILLVGLTKLARVVIVLNIVQRRALLNDFVENKVTDKDMTDDPDSAVKALRSDRDYIKVQYYRANRRPWDDGTTLDLHPYEPIPLKTQHIYSDEERGLHIEKVEDAWDPSQVYVRKVVWKNQARKETNRQFEIEVKCLQTLGSVSHGHHIIQVVKSYSRGPETGILIRPVADENLGSLLEKCCSDPKERPLHQDSLLRAFGCLTYSMSYLHNAKMLRHQDVKPENILCLREPNGSATFVWSDFGLTYDFSHKIREGLPSGTRTRLFESTPGYAAPEVNHDKEFMHGRSADIFSLGCTFLEIASVLLLLPNAVEVEPEVRIHLNYKDHIPQLQNWADTKRQPLEKTKPREKYLREILKIARSMMAEKPKDRPKIGEVALKLGDFKHGGDGTVRTFCDRCASKYPKDKVQDPSLFKWEKLNRKNPFAKIGILHV